jgi:hypothetical protein
MTLEEGEVIDFEQSPGRIVFWTWHCHRLRQSNPAAGWLTRLGVGLSAAQLPASQASGKIHHLRRKPHR